MVSGEAGRESAPNALEERPQPSEPERAGPVNAPHAFRPIPLAGPRVGRTGLGPAHPCDAARPGPAYGASS